MEVQFKWPEAKADKLANETGRPTGELRLSDIVDGYFEELAGVRQCKRQDDLKSGRLQPIDGEQPFALLKAKTEAQRNRSQ